MTLFEIYYHDPWRTRSTYARQYITTSADDAAQWLLEHLDEWYGDDDQEIDDVIEQGLEQTFNYINNHPLKWAVCLTPLRELTNRD